MIAKRTRLAFNTSLCENCKAILSGKSDSSFAESQYAGRLCVGVYLGIPPKSIDKEDVVSLCVEEFPSRWRKLGDVYRVHCTRDEARKIGQALIEASQNI